MDRFRLQQLLGRGSFGQVHRVQRIRDGKIYALKTILLGRLDAKSRQDALNEVRFLASLRHPHIVRFYEAFLQPAHRRLCIVMEYASGGDLDKIIRRRRRLSETVIWRYAAQIADALQYLHRRRILHRDLKPANCFLDRKGHIKLGDLNVSRRVRPNAMAKTQIGTPYYMSPEIWRNQPYSFSCDMWAFGCLLHQLAALEVPFRGHSMPHLVRNIKRGVIPPLPPAYSDFLGDTIRTLLHPRSHMRPTASAIAGMLCRAPPAASAPGKTLLPTIRLKPYLQQVRMPVPQYDKHDKAPALLLPEIHRRRSNPYWKSPHHATPPHRFRQNLPKIAGR